MNRTAKVIQAQAPFPTPANDNNSQFSEVYLRLKAMASRHRFRSGDATLCTTELVHEAYLRMNESGYQHSHPAQFFAYAARVMRHVLIDAARRRLQPKRGGNLTRMDLGDAATEAVQIDPQLALQLDQAITALEREDARAAQVVELHYFAGLDLQQIADTLGVVRRTIDRDWRFARAFLAARAET
jgi:RNA polymerase sigma factor (TIGR02999 family)